MSQITPTSKRSGTPVHAAVVGLQWGDEGKGKIVDLLTSRYDCIVRYNGGANAGHTVQVGKERYALHLIPSGILSSGKINIVGNGVVVDPEKVLDEIDGLRARGVEVGANLRISDRAHVVMPYHKDQDAALEELLEKRSGKAGASGSIGTTRRGIGPAYSDKVRRSTALRMGDLLDHALLLRKLDAICGLRMAELEALGATVKPLVPKELADRFAAAGERLRPHIDDTVYLLHDQIRAGRSVLFEGANACLLDIDHGTFPYVTSSNCSTLGIPAGSGVPGRMIGKVYGIMKAYSTRVGGGPFVTELLDATGERIRQRGREYGTTTGRPRRCGWLDLVAVKYSVMVCGADAIACTLLDVLSGFDELKICTGYRRADGTVTDRFIPDAERMHGFTPVYETLPGWQRELGTCTDRDDLPVEARRYLGFVEEFVGIPVELVSVGPERTQTFESNERFAAMR
ncbi:MAG: adenylosuccinate synthase [Planctomycetaceae bacterium]|nr:adenylosuccinate synthase [Planctomycetaceae bacterium]